MAVLTTGGNAVLSSSFEVGHHGGFMLVGDASVIYTRRNIVWINTVRPCLVSRLLRKARSCISPFRQFPPGHSAV